jgi:hypothetical protein
VVPAWLHVLAIVSLFVGFICAVWITIDEIRHPQQMWIMNLVWPITALYGGLLALWFYYAYGQTARQRVKQDPPYAIIVAKGALHCGSGCTLSDILAEWLAFLFPAVAIWFGYTTLFSEKMFAV